MLSNVFYWVLNMSITACMSAAAVLLLRCVKQIPRRVIMLLWAVPALRMVVPFGLGSRFSLMNLLDGIFFKTVPAYALGEDTLSSMNVVQAAQSYFPLVYKKNAVQQVFFAGGAIWLSVSILLLTAVVCVYFHSYIRIKNLCESKQSVCRSEAVVSPAVYGIVKPVIALPVGLSKEDEGYILLHEKAHLRRRDNLWRLLAVLICCVHWFNPLTWLFLKCFLKDLELACDESVLTKIGAEHKREYARVLVKFASTGTLLTSSFSASGLKGRIENILSFQKMSALSAIGFAALLIALAAVLLTNAK